MLHWKKNIFLLILKLTYSIVKKIEKITERYKAARRQGKNLWKLAGDYQVIHKRDKDGLAWNRITEEDP